MSLRTHLSDAHPRLRRARWRGSAGIALGAATALVVAGAAPIAGQEHDAAKAGVVRDGDRWLLKGDLAAGPADQSFVYGNDDALHVMGDWNGDGERTPGVVRPETDPAFSDEDRIPLVWYLRTSNEAGPADIVFRYGEATSRETFDQPIVGDWDGDGVETVGVVRTEADPEPHYEWRLRNDLRAGEPDVVFSYGDPGGFGIDPEAERDVPVVGDWDGDGVTTAGVVREDPDPDTAQWLLKNDHRDGAADISFFYANAGDRPIVGDWDGDGTETAGIVRDATRWMLTDSHEDGPAEHVFHYGADERDRPIVWR